MRIALKFCGSCNPEIDLSTLARQLKVHTANRADVDVIPVDSADIDVLIILCGCLRACADKEEVKAQARRHLTIAGQSLAGNPQNEGRLATMLAAEIDRLLPPALSD